MRPVALASRLVATAVALVLLVSLLIGGVATVAVRSYLLGRLEEDTRAALVRAAAAPPLAYVEDPGAPGGTGTGTGSAGDGPGYDPDHDQRADFFGQGVGTLTAYFEGFSDYEGDPVGTVIASGEDGTPVRRTLDAATLARLAALPADGSVHEVHVGGYGEYLVAARSTSYGVAVAGLPTRDVDDLVGTLLRWEALLLLLGGGLAVVAGRVVVRRQLRPLREVAATAHEVASLPLATGDIEIGARVPDHLTDERTEVGQVGAALNALLEHVEGSLEARHRSEQQVRQFVADASHELRTPLATIAGYTQLARRRPDDPTAVGTALEKVTEESGRMTALVEDLLLLARLDAGRPLERRPVDVRRLLVEAVADARVLAPTHQWRLDLGPGEDDLGPDDPGSDPGFDTVVGDEGRLHQVVTNLLTNARKYTPAGSTVTVTALPDGFRVHDDGPGFDPDLAARAFERFTRGDVARTREGGAGLGLSLVHAIVAAHHGTVTLASSPGDTTFEVHLPTVPSVEPAR